MSLTLVGYFPKTIIKRPDWLANPAVEYICSVSRCIAHGPPNWVDCWRHNALWLFDSESLARSVIPADAAASTFAVFAYRLLPSIFDEGHEAVWSPPHLKVSPLGAFEGLGFDVVGNSMGYVFDCSPLSCNRFAESIPVNRYCLIDRLADAVKFAAFASRRDAGAEPVPYHVVEVMLHRDDLSNIDEFSRHGDLSNKAAIGNRGTETDKP